jgi:hypothetical protein
MRRLLPLLGVFLIASTAVTTQALAQQTRREKEEQQKRKAEKAKEDAEKRRKKDQRGPAPLDVRRAQGPCPYVKVLYDAARYVEFTGAREVSSDVAYSGEIEGIQADCLYKAAEPIVVDMAIRFDLGKGPQAQSASKSYRYWIAVTERNKAILEKQYFDLPVQFPAGQDRVVKVERFQGVTIPRAAATVSGNNFEILVGFDVTPQQAEFNRAGKRFRINAGQTTAQTGSSNNQ